MTSTAAPPYAPATPPPGGRTVTDVLRRGFDNTIANWPLILVRVCETVAFGTLAILAVLVIVMPLLVSIGISGLESGDPAAIAERIFGGLAGNVLVLVWIVLVFLVLVMVFALIHSFVVAGIARVLVDGEAAAGGGTPPRDAFAAFSMARWWDGAVESWWVVFWIYNIAYGVASLVILAPVVLVGVIALLFRESPAGIIVGCLGLVLTVLLSLVVLLLTSVLCQKSIVVRVARGTDAWESLVIAWDEIFERFGQHFVVALVLIVIAIGGSGVIGSISILFSLPAMALPFGPVLMIPIRILISMLQGVFGGATSNWMLASFAAMTRR